MNESHRPGTMLAAIALLAFGACATAQLPLQGEPSPYAHGAGERAGARAGARAGERAGEHSGTALAELAGAELAGAELAGEVRAVDLLRLALARNPAVAAARERAAAALEGAAAEGWLPNPTLMLGWYETSVQTRVGPQEWSLGISQMIPFPSKLAARSDVAGLESRRAAVRYERVVRDVLTQVVETVHEIAYLDEAVAISAAISPLLDRYAAAAAGGEAAAALSELFRAEAQRAQLENDRVVLRELRAAETERLLSLLDLPLGTSIGAVSPPAPPALAMSYEGLLRAAREASLELREAGIATEVAESRASLAGMRHLPDFTLGVTRIFTSRLDGALRMNPDGNGEDPVVLSLGVSLPLWVTKDRAAIREARALGQAARDDRREAEAGMRRRLAAAWYRAGNAERLVLLYGEVLLPRAAAAAETAEGLLAAGKGTIAGSLETIAVYHNFRLAEARARADFGRAVAELESIVGRPFAVEGGER